MQDRQENQSLSSQSLITAYKKETAEGRLTALVTLLYNTIPFDDDTEQVKTLIRRARTASMRVCYDYKAFRAQLSEETLIDIARTTDGIAITLDRVDARTERIEIGQTKTNESLQDIKDDLCRLHEQHKNDPDAALEYLRDIAVELAHPKPHRGNWEGLITYITDKVQELQATIARYEEAQTGHTSANTRSEIARLLQERRYAEVQKLFDGILEMGRDGELNQHLQNAAFALAR